MLITETQPDGLASITIETARLRLRAHRDGDLADLVSLVGVWEVAKWLSALPHPYTDAHGRDWIARVRQAHAVGHPRSFAIALKETDRLIGGAGLDGSSGNDSDEPSLGYWLGVPYQGHGYGREATAAVISYGFGALGLESIRAIAAPDNAPSQKVLMICGLKKVADVELLKPLRTGAHRAPLFRMSRHDVAPAVA